MPPLRPKTVGINQITKQTAERSADQVRVRQTASRVLPSLTFLERRKGMENVPSDRGGHPAKARQFALRVVRAGFSYSEPWGSAWQTQKDKRQLNSSSGKPRQSLRREFNLSEICFTCDYDASSQRPAG